MVTIAGFFVLLISLIICFTKDKAEAEVKCQRKRRQDSDDVESGPSSNVGTAESELEAEEEYDVVVESYDNDGGYDAGWGGDDGD